MGGWESTEFMAQMLARVKYDAWTPGERELFYGAEKLQKLATDLNCDAVSANLTDQNDKLIFKDRVIKTIGSMKIGITGVTSKTVYETVPAAQTMATSDFKFRDPFESLKPVVADLQKQTDVVVVLGHVGAGDARRLAEEVPGIDVVIAGHNPGYMPSPDRVGDVLIVRAGTRGQYGAKLNITLDNSGKVVDYKGVAEPLNESMVVDAAVGNEVQKYLDGLARKEADAARNRALDRANAQGRDKYLGDEICARCHSEIYSQYAKGPHATAFQTLLTAKKETDRSCVGCHVTGFGDPSGYQMVTYRQDTAGKPDTTDSVELRNVQCESCHGKGTLHGSLGMVKKVTREMCQTCHDTVNDPKFDFDKAIAAGLHHK